MINFTIDNDAVVLLMHTLNHVQELNQILDSHVFASVKYTELSVCVNI